MIMILIKVSVDPIQPTSFLRAKVLNIGGWPVILTGRISNMSLTFIELSQNGRDGLIISKYCLSFSHFL